MQFHRVLPWILPFIWVKYARGELVECCPELLLGWCMQDKLFTECCPIGKRVCVDVRKVWKAKNHAKSRWGAGNESRDCIDEIPIFSHPSNPIMGTRVWSRIRGNALVNASASMCSVLQCLTTMRPSWIWCRMKCQRRSMCFVRWWCAGFSER